MRAIAVSPRSKTLNSLLKKARRKSVILEAAGGELFMLMSMRGLEAFEVGNSPSFAVEARRTAKNKSLATLMARRRDANKGKPRTSMNDLKRKLDLE